MNGSAAKIQPKGTKIRLPLHLKQMGCPETCGHRSGWRHVVQHLRSVNDPGGVVLDDFVERTFQHQDSGQVWQEPWVGIFHHPPNLPPWFDQTAPPPVITQLPAFRASLPHLRGAVALSAYLGGWLRSELQVPVLVVKHPTEIPILRFSIERWETQAFKQLVQIGWYARNYRGIYQVGVPDGFRKIHLLQDRPWVQEATARTDLAGPFRSRPDVGNVELIGRLDDQRYDELLASSVVFCEYLDVSASNTVIEAIARNTPIVVNRLPALEEYLGKDYPLFYERIEEVPAMLGDRERIRRACALLSAMDKSWLSVESFALELLSFVNDVVPARSTP
jgi:hypothetical protein